MKTGILAAALVFGLISTQAQSAPSPAMWKEYETRARDLDLFWGNGSEERRPQGPFKFVEEDKHGSNPKITVLDATGQRWGVKFGDEVHSEVAASRFFWAAGFRVDEVYFVPSGVVRGAKNLGKASQHVNSKGAFKNARFKRASYDEGLVSVKSVYNNWKWSDNPFVGQKELSGLKLLNILLSNFDTKPENNMVQVATYEDGSVVSWYMVGDIGGCFGKTGGGGLFKGHSKWDLKDYKKEGIVRGISKESISLYHKGKNAEDFDSVPLAHAQWFIEQIGDWSLEQIEDGFRAALSDQKVTQLRRSSDEKLAKGFASVLYKRLQKLKSAVGKVKP